MSVKNFTKNPICEKCGWGNIELRYREAVDRGAYRARIEMYKKDAEKHPNILWPIDYEAMTCPGWPEEHIDCKCPRCGHKWEMRTMLT